MDNDMRMGSITFGPIATGPNAELAGLLEQAAKHIMTPKEVYEQRVSFIYGQLMDAAPHITEKYIREWLASIGIVDPSQSTREER